jgi:hypothetical protein
MRGMPPRLMLSHLRLRWYKLAPTGMEKPSHGAEISRGLIFPLRKYVLVWWNHMVIPGDHVMVALS